MDSKIATKVDTTLNNITFDELNEESALKNELLINELLYTIKSEEKYISRDEIELIEEYKILKNDLDKICNELRITSVYDIVEKYNKVSTNRDYYIKQYNQAAVLVDRKAAYVERLKAKINSQLSIINKKHALILKLKDDLQKNKKIIDKKHALVLKLKKDKEQNTEIIAKKHALILKLKEDNAKLKEDNAKLKEDNAKLIKKNKTINNKYRQQKNRKIVKIVDRIAGK